MLMWKSCFIPRQHSKLFVHRQSLPPPCFHLHHVLPSVFQLLTFSIQSLFRFPKVITPFQLSVVPQIENRLLVCSSNCFHLFERYASIEVSNRGLSYNPKSIS